MTEQPSCLTVTLLVLLYPPAPLVADANRSSHCRKDYQLHGLSWLYNMYENGVNGILGDEMGLGKTVQTLSLLAHLKTLGKGGPHLIIAPLSVLESWIREIKRFTPTLKALRFHGVAKERARLKAIAQSQKEPYDVIVTTYEMMICEEAWFKHRFTYRYVIIDEGHRIKNEQTQLGLAVQTLSAQNRLLLTGTPLQNNLRELWSLLHWLMPDVFTENTSKVFEEGFNITRGVLDTQIMDAARNLLERFMLRRLKSQVDLNIPTKSEMNIYLPLTPMQKWWYKRMITKLDSLTLKEIFESKSPKPEAEEDTSTVGGETNSNSGMDNEMAAAFHLDEAEELVKKAGGDRQWTKLMGLLFQLRKVTNHPYLLPGSEPEPYQNGEHLILASSKFILLDKLLPKLKKEGHRCLIFSGFTRMLDILEDYLNFRGYSYSRLDGQTSRAKRNLDIKLFQKQGSENFVYLLSTRAGGLGINLTGADTCIFYDSDWNPQADVQAMARCHRIGQTKPVTIYRLVTKDTVEERILSRTLKKLYLSLKVTEECQDSTSTEPKFTRNDLVSMIRSGSRSVVDNSNPLDFLKASIEEILEKSKQHADSINAAVESEKADEDIENEIFQSTENFGLRFFDGEEHKATKSDVAKEWKDLMKRARTERTVKIAGHMVLAETVACGEWEAVKTMTSASAPPKVHQSKRPSARNFQYDEECYACREGGLIMLCSRCPRVYHPRCVDLTKNDVARLITWTCPQHRCCECSRVTTDAGGLLFRCVGCPHAWCEDCLPDEEKIEPIGDVNPYLEARGFGYVKQAYYIKCDGASVLRFAPCAIR
ncbi:SNF2 family N-terminal domain-containing protein [Hyaloraphidium curvatum]|nr:SNF2 family N-terminal domain-containing protein [Hyaloraphidium curvatum]